MAEPSLTTVADSYAQARGVPDDARWARTAAGRFALDGVRDDLARTALEAVAEQVALTGESPEDLWGKPVEWAREQERTWREDGVDPAEPRTAPGARALVLEAFVGASMIAVMLFLVRALSWSWTQRLSVPLLAAPLLLAGAGVVVRVVHERVRRRRSQRAAVVGAGVALVLLAPALAGVLLATKDWVVAEVSTFWLLALAGAYAAAGTLLARMWPASTRRRASTPLDRPDDEAWLGELAAALRERGDMSDERVRRIVAETRDHAIDARQPLHVEFGDPGAHAARFAPDERVAGRRRAWFFTCLAVVPAGMLTAYVVEDGWRWGSPHLSALLWLLLNVGLAATGWRRVSRTPDVGGSTYR